MNRLYGWYGTCVPTVETVGCGDGGCGSVDEAIGW